MRAISLWQPWATLIAMRAKRVETRGWYTDYRGPLVICAAKKWGWDLFTQCIQPGFFEVLNLPRYSGLAPRAVPKPLPLGVAVATCRLIDCVRSERFYEQYKAMATEQELRFGDYGPGRFAWVLSEIEPFAVPPPIRGEQGFFEVDDAVIAAARGAVPEPAKKEGLFDG